LGDDGEVMAIGGGAMALTANTEVELDPTRVCLRIWDLSEKDVSATISIQDKEGGLARCDAAVFSPGGRMLSSSQVSEYQGIRPSYGAAQLRLWERASGQHIRMLTPAITRLLAFSPNGRLLAAGCAGASGHLTVGYGVGVDIWDTLTGEKARSLSVTP